MRPSSADKVKVYAAYGITSHAPGQYEVDHIIPVELLGLVDAPAGDPTENLYPEPNDKADPATIAREGLNPAFIENSKDILEDVLHRDVCAGAVPLATAQHAIATDWRTAYVRYVGSPPAASPSPAATVTSKAPVTHAAAPPPTHTATHSAAPAHAACHPLSNAGNCYEPGEFCRKADRGTSGIAGDGKRITCVADGSRSRWE